MQPDISATGRFVVFASTATNLAPNDTGKYPDIFIRDRVAGTTRLISKGVAGAEADGASSWPVVSDDGRYVAFRSDATNLVPGDGTRMPGIFRADLTTGAIIRVSVSTSGQANDWWCENLDMSADGRYVVFATAAGNLVPGDTNRTGDVFLRDVPEGRTTRVSLTPAGSQQAARSMQPSISPDGRLVAFYSMDGPRSINQWSRATNAVSIVHRDTDVEGYYDVSGRPRVSNAGVSFSRQWYKDAADMTGWAVSVRNPAGTFRVADDSRGGVLSLVSYDIDRTGRRAVVSVSNGNGREGFIHIVDRSMDPPNSAAALATLREPNRQPALAGTAPVVAYADNPSRQVMVWNWQTGAVTPVSVR